MRVFCIVLLTFTFVLFTASTRAQTRPATSSPTSSKPAVASANVIAIVDSGEFTEQKTGITRVVSALAALDVKFTPVNNELKGMQERLNTLRTDIQKKRQVQDVNQTAQQTDQADQLEVQMKRKAEDARAAYQREMNNSLSPLQADIGSALNAYAKARGILLVIDVNRVPVIYADNSIDITKEFIAEYNRTHPAMAPAAPARP